MSLLCWDKGVTLISETGPTRDERLPDQRKILAVQRVKLPRYWREGAVEVRPFPAKTRLRASEAQGFSGEAMRGNPPTTVIPRVDESKTTPEELSEPGLTWSLQRLNMSRHKYVRGFVNIRNSYYHSPDRILLPRASRDSII
jgi:hypothetical protein